jgi:hypothetical protein
MYVSGGVKDAASWSEGVRPLSRRLTEVGGGGSDATAETDSRGWQLGSWSHDTKILRLFQRHPARSVAGSWSFDAGASFDFSS